MPGRLFYRRSATEMAATLGLTLTGQGDTGSNIAPGAAILVHAGDGLLRPMRWGMIMSGRVNARGRPVMETIVNARAETHAQKAAFLGVRRGLVPCDGWYEWTGPKGRKTQWTITRRDAAPIVFAAIWDVWSGPGGVELSQVATLTCAANADLARYHDRMGVLVDPAEQKRWLAGEAVELDPAPKGSLTVEQHGP